jgi:hypothetical protein
MQPTVLYTGLPEAYANNMASSDYFLFFFLGSYTWAQSPKRNWHCPPGEKQSTRP